MKKLSIAVCAGVLFGWGLLNAGAQTTWKVAKTFAVGGEGGWDYLTVDAEGHRLFVPRTTHTMVLDEQTGKVLGDIPGQKNAHGVALVPELGRGFISDGGGAGAIVVFDLKTYAVLGRIAAQPDADGILYDAAEKKVLVVSGDKGLLMTFAPEIDPAGGTMDPAIELGGAPEFLATNGVGKVYVNLEDKDVVAEVNLKTRKVEARWPVAPGGSPVGMAIDRNTGRLFLGCRKPQKLVVMSTQDGKVLSSVDIGEGVDATVFDGRDAFASTRDGVLTVARENGAGRFAMRQMVKTAVGARTMGLDASTRTIYLPTAEFEPRPAGASGRPVMKPGSFKIVVVQRQEMR